MTRKESIKKFHIIPQPVVNIGKSCCTKFTDRRNFDHPYCRDASRYGTLWFFIMLTAFETRPEGGYACYGYETPPGPYAETVAALKELSEDWNRPGRRPWNSISLIGIDERGRCFSAMDEIR